MKGLTMHKWVCAAGMALLLAPAGAFAARFTNQFIEFELPPQWQCNLEGAEWVCQSTNEAKKKDAIIVLAAKLKGESDSLDQYLAYLKSAKTYTSVQGKPVKSDVKYAKTVSLQGQVWVDALHLESEIPGFFTRYLATVKSDIGVLITYSVNKAKWQDYTSDFEALIQTLKVFRKPGGVNQGIQPQSTGLPTVTIPPNMDSQAVFPAVQGGADDQAPMGRKRDDTTMYIIGIALLALFIIWRKKRSE